MHRAGRRILHLHVSAQPIRGADRAEAADAERWRMAGAAGRLRVHGESSRDRSCAVERIPDGRIDGDGVGARVCVRGACLSFRFVCGFCQCLVLYFDSGCLCFSTFGAVTLAL